MNKIIGLFSLALCLISCNKQEKVEVVPEDLTPNIDWIKIEASSLKLPLNSYGISHLSATSELGNDITSETVFYVNGEKMDSTTFKPTEIGNYLISGIYKDLQSPEIELIVKEPLNKKVLIEYFTSKYCGACPWIGARVDSLHKSNNKVISYTIHDRDELEVPESMELFDYQKVFGRPTIRVDRVHMEDYLAALEIQPLIDSINHFLSILPEAGLSINSNLENQVLNIEVKGKFYEAIDKELFLTISIIEDNIITSDQINSFSGAEIDGCPFIHEPDPIPNYVNHNTLRKTLTKVRGDELMPTNFESGQEELLQIIQQPVDALNITTIEDAYIIAILHERKEEIGIPSVLNAQIVKVGESVSFEE